MSAQDDDDYNSASDSDFDHAELSASSAGEESEEVNEKTTRRQKRKNNAKDIDGDVEMASGDEGIVAQGRKKRKKKGTSKAKGKGKGKGKSAEADDEDDEEDEDEDEAPVGVRVKLRSGRGGAAEAKKTALPIASAATVDIESIWARMNNPQASQPPPPPPPQPPILSSEKEKEAEVEAADKGAAAKTTDATDTTVTSAAVSADTTPQASEATITIPHTYIFAGQTHTSSKRVPASSPAAVAYLASIKDPNQTNPSTQQSQPASKPASPPLRRPLARKNLLEPNPSCLITSRGGVALAPRTDLPASIGGSYTITKTTTSTSPSALLKAKAHKPPLEKEEKLNTVEKSKLDWEAEVERAGMREELERAEKSGSSYLGRVEFLRRVEGGEEERARVARLRRAGVA